MESRIRVQIRPDESESKGSEMWIREICFRYAQKRIEVEQQGGATILEDEGSLWLLRR